MSKLTAWERKAKIRKGEPITVEIGGDPERALTFYPIIMSHYEEFLECKYAWTIRMTSLASQYMAMPYLSALWAIDLDSQMGTGHSVGLFTRILKLLYLCLRLGYESEKAFGGIYYLSDDPRKLQYIQVTQDGKTVKITPQDFTVYIRPLIAAQNGFTLPDESYNPELVEAERILSEKSESAKVKFDVDTLISSVAYLSNIDEKDLDEWTVLKFERRKAAIDRDKMFTLYKQATLSGMVTFKGEIPYPSWCFDADDKQLSGALRTTQQAGEHFKAIGDLNQAVSNLAKPNKVGYD